MASTKEQTYPDKETKHACGIRARSLILRFGAFIVYRNCSSIAKQKQDSLRSLGAKRLMEVTNVVECQELKPDEQLFAEGDDSEVRAFSKRERTAANALAELMVFNRNLVDVNQHQFLIEKMFRIGKADIHERRCVISNLARRAAAAVRHGCTCSES